MLTKTEFQGQPVYLLTNGEGTARFAPQCGARLLDWRVAGRELVTWPANADWGAVNKVRGGNPILFPFIARHYVDGELGKWRDAQGVVRSLPMHGFARDMAFTVVDDPDPDTIRMRIEQTPQTLEDYPFSFRFEVAYRLLPDALEVEFATTNPGAEPLPYYAGHHFYLAVNHAERSRWKLALPFRKTGVQGKDGAPVFGPAPGDATLDQPELVDRFQIEPLERRFALMNRRDGVEIEFDLQPREPQPTAPWYNVTTWTMAPESDFYCVEPWLGLPDAIHHGHGLRHVAPGQTEKAVCRLTYRAL